MDPLTFSFVETEEKRHVQLHQIPAHTIVESTWQNFGQNVAAEPFLVSYPEAILAQRWQQGYAAIAVKDYEIISYTSLIPIFSDPTRQKLSQAIGLHPEQMPYINMYRAATGWTHPDWRQRGLSQQLRHHLLKRFSGPNHLFMSIARGLGAGPVLTKMDWQMISWSKIAYVSSLIGLPEAGLTDKLGPDMKRVDLKPYTGPPLSPSNSTHPWNSFCYFWVSNIPLAMELNYQLAKLMEEELQNWREAVVTVLNGRPKPAWKLMIFNSLEENQV